MWEWRDIWQQLLTHLQSKLLSHFICWIVHPIQTNVYLFTIKDTVWSSEIVFKRLSECLQGMNGKVPSLVKYWLTRYMVPIKECSIGYLKQCKKLEFREMWLTSHTCLCNESLKCCIYLHFIFHTYLWNCHGSIEMNTWISAFTSCICPRECGPYYFHMLNCVG